MLRALLTVLVLRFPTRLESKQTDWIRTRGVETAEVVGVGCGSDGVQGLRGHLQPSSSGNCRRGRNCDYYISALVPGLRWMPIYRHLIKLER